MIQGYGTDVSLTSLWRTVCRQDLLGKAGEGGGHLLRAL